MINNMLLPMAYKMPVFLVAAGLLTIGAATAAAQEPADPQTTATQTAAEPAPIADNSFLVEEAYNQEWGVVQHISSFTRFWQGRDWAFTFTQEWPVNRAPRHQLSYTLVAERPGAGGSGGFGDVALNYRYQLLGGGDATVAFSPRFSVLLPTGNSSRGRGAGGVGFQTNLPFSIRTGKRLVTHWNAGATFVPSARNEAGERAFAAGYNLGQSFVWLAHPRFNVLLETVWHSMDSVVAPDTTVRENSLLISPGIRWAHNLPGGLQIVPGVAVPIGAGPSRGETGIIFYLSLEHPFRRRAD